MPMHAIDPRAVLRRVLRLKQFSYATADRMNGRSELCLKLLYDRRPRGEILNVGSSHGWLEDLTRSQSAFRVTGIEYDPTSLARARELVPGAQICQGSVLDLPFENESFEGATMFEVIEHLPRGSEEAALREIFRTLKPGAWLLLSTPYVLTTLLDPLWYFGHRHYSKESMARLVRAAGFALDYSFVRGGVWDLLTVDLFFLFKFAMDAESPFRERLERMRRREFLGEKNGLSDLFVVARKPEPAAAHTSGS